MLDDLEGHNEWKYKNNSKLYDWERVMYCLASMKALRKQNAVRTLSHQLRQDLVKNFCCISEPDLYNKAHYGTKRLIEKYHNEVIKCIQLIYSCQTTNLSLQ